MRTVSLIGLFWFKVCQYLLISDCILSVKENSPLVIWGCCRCLMLYLNLRKHYIEFYSILKIISMIINCIYFRLIIKYDYEMEIWIFIDCQIKDIGSIQKHSFVYPLHYKISFVQGLCCVCGGVLKVVHRVWRKLLQYSPCNHKRMNINIKNELRLS